MQPPRKMQLDGSSRPAFLHHLCAPASDNGARSAPAKDRCGVALRLRAALPSPAVCIQLQPHRSLLPAEHLPACPHLSTDRLSDSKSSNRALTGQQSLHVPASLWPGRRVGETPLLAPASRRPLPSPLLFQQACAPLISPPSQSLVSPPPPPAAASNAFKSSAIGAANVLTAPGCDSAQEAHQRQRRSSASPRVPVASRQSSHSSVSTHADVAYAMWLPSAALAPGKGDTRRGT
jgi:hypothetical protein